MMFESVRTRKKHEIFDMSSFDFHRTNRWRQKHEKTPLMCMSIYVYSYVFVEIEKNVTRKTQRV